MNVALLKKIKARILAKPQKFRMDEWTCGTAHCIGGWACVLSGLKFEKPATGLAALYLTDGRDIETAAYEALDIENEPGFKLSAEDQWPEQFQSKPNASRKLRAKRAAARIDHFIATGGAE